MTSDSESAAEDLVSSKKIRKANEQKQSDGQIKITSFFTKHTQSQHKVPKHLQIIQMRLEKELSELREREEELIQAKDLLRREAEKSDLSFQSYIKVSQDIIADCLSSAYRRVRESRKMIDPAKGYYLKGSHKFVTGSQYEQSISRINHINEQIADCNPGSFRYNFLAEALAEEQRRNGFLMAELETYKSRLRLAMEEQDCLFADQWPVIHKKYQVLELLGKGGFSEVYRAYNLATNKYCALKVNYVSDYGGQHSHHLAKQYEIHKNLNHRNVVKMEEYFELSADRICLVLQLCDGPELSTYMRKKTFVPENQAKVIMQQIFSALNYLSSSPHKVIHYDLKPQNIMFHGGNIKLLDFGLCKQVEDDSSLMALTNQGAGTFWYLPPEAFHWKNPKISCKVDVWSAGIIFFEMLYGCKPFGNNMSQVNLLNQGVILSASEVSFPDFPEVSAETKMFIRKCLAYSTQDRLSPAQAFNHSYFIDDN